MLFDIETSPLLGYTWEIYDTNVIEIVQDWYMLSFAVKWLDEKKTRVYTLADFRGYTKDKANDYKLVKKLWDYLSEADLVIAHNGDQFDIKKANARFIAHGLAPPAPNKTVDTLKVARKHFKFTSNKLDDLGNILGVGRKVAHTGKHLWLSCMRGDRKAWKIMAKYNKQDVVLLEKVYLKLRPYMATHPNNVSFGQCPVCQSFQVQKRGSYWSLKRKYQRYQCQSCGHWYKGELIK